MKAVIRLKIELITYGSEQGDYVGVVTWQRGTSIVESPLMNDECKNILDSVDEKMVHDKIEDKVIQSPLN